MIFLDLTQQQTVSVAFIERLLPPLQPESATGVPGSYIPQSWSYQIKVTEAQFEQMYHRKPIGTYRIKGFALAIV